jgi:hypothetical protein
MGRRGQATLVLFRGRGRGIVPLVPIVRGSLLPVVWRVIGILVQDRSRRRGWRWGRALWGRGRAILVLVLGRNIVPLVYGSGLAFPIVWRGTPVLVQIRGRGRGWGRGRALRRRGRAILILVRGRSIVPLVCGGALDFPIVWRGTPILVRSRDRGRGRRWGSALWGRRNIVPLVCGIGLNFPIVWRQWRGIPDLVRSRGRGRGRWEWSALWWRGRAILVLVLRWNNVPPVCRGGPDFLWGRRRLGLFRDRCSIPLRLRTVVRLDYDAVSLTLSRNERCKTKVFAGTTSAIDTSGELDAELLRTSLHRSLEDMSEYERNEYDEKHLQKDHL